MKITKLILPLLATGMLFAASGAELYNAKCKVCHGIDGSIKAIGKSKAINGMPVKEVEAVMNAYASGEKVSLPFVKTLKEDFVIKHTKEDLKKVAKYINTL